MLYVDTSVIVTPFLRNREPVVIDRCLALLDDAAGRGVELATSWLNWDEVAWSLGRKDGRFDRERAAEYAQALLEVEFLRFCEVDEQVISTATRLLSESSARPRDCIHAATALLHCGGQLVSLDSDFGKEKMAHHGLKPLDP